MTAVVVFFWMSLGALAWTHAVYPLLARVVARFAERPVRRGEIEPSVTVVVTAHDEEAVIEGRIANLRALDYPTEKIAIVVTSDASTDRTEELAVAAGARVVRNERMGK